MKTPPSDLSEKSQFNHKSQYTPDKKTLQRKKCMTYKIYPIRITGNLAAESLKQNFRVLLLLLFCVLHLFSIGQNNKLQSIEVNQQQNVIKDTAQ
jgi:hypothetical protein